MLCRMYPASFRARFEAGLRHSFLCDLARARTRGAAAAALFWVLTAADVIRFGACERLRHLPLSTPASGPGGASMLSLLTADLRDGWRSLRGTPVVTAVAIVSLALGIGANTALFSILNSLVLKALPVREPARLALVADGDWTNPIWEQMRQRQPQFADGAFAWSATRFDLASTGETDFVDGAWVSGGMFDVLGVPAARGRVIGDADDRRGGGPDGPVAVISYPFWQRRFGGAADIVGRTLTISRVPFTIVGVMPQGFFGPDVGRSMDVAVPIGSEPLIRGRESALDARSTWWLSIMVRLRPGQSVEQATALLRGVQPQIREATIPANWPAAEQKQYLTDAFTLTPAASGESPLRKQYVQPLTVLLIVVGLVLLIACANIASLLLARAVARRHEFSVRLALGASRLRLSRQLLVESVLLAGAGAALGLVFAHWASRTVVAQLTSGARTVSLDLALDWRVLAFTTGVTAATVLLFGLAPAFGVSAVAPQESLKEQARGVAGGRRMTLRHAIVVVQVALSLTLVVAALLFARTFTALVTRDIGFDRDPVLLVNVSARRSAETPERRLALFAQLRDAAAAVPGVSHAAASFTSPVGTSGWNMAVKVPPDSTLGRRERMAWVNAVTPDWFATYGIDLAAGRDVAEADTGGPRLAVVNRAFANRFLKPGNPVGQQFEPGDAFAGTAPYRGHRSGRGRRLSIRARGDDADRLHSARRSGTARPQTLSSACDRPVRRR